MKLYNQLTSWWHLFSAPKEYSEEANLYIELIGKNGRDIRSCLELGCGGGNNAFYLKQHFEMTLTDRSFEMLQQSKKINPECEHVQGDMRNIQFNKIFDLVFIHDAISYITSKNDLSMVFEVAHRHLLDGGMIFIMPDEYKETFIPKTTSGGNDGDRRSIRYLEWTYDPNPDDSLIAVE